MSQIRSDVLQANDAYARGFGDKGALDAGRPSA